MVWRANHPFFAGETTGVPACTVCGENKDVEAFGFRNKAAGRRHRKCKTCVAAYGRTHYARNRQTYITRNVGNTRVLRARRRRWVRQLWDYLTAHPCVDCGAQDPRILEFDHRDRRTKAESVTLLARRGVRWSRIEAEIAKCDVRCANCHRRRTAAQFNWPKLVLSRSNEAAKVDLAGLEPANLSDANRALSQLSYRPKDGRTGL
jgi:hypothetical protein